MARMDTKEVRASGENVKMSYQKYEVDGIAYTWNEDEESFTRTNFLITLMRPIN